MKENFHFSQGGKEKRLLFSLGFAGKKKGENALSSLTVTGERKAAESRPPSFLPLSVTKEKFPENKTL